MCTLHDETCTCTFKSNQKLNFCNLTYTTYKYQLKTDHTNNYIKIHQQYTALYF